MGKYTLNKKTRLLWFLWYYVFFWKLLVWGKGDDKGWDGWMASLTRWTWVWVNSGNWWWTGRPGMQWFMGSQSWTWLNWTELSTRLTRLLSGKELTCQAQDTGSIPRWRDPGVENSNCPSTPAWKIPWTEEPGEIQFMGLQRVRSNWVHTHMLNCTPESQTSLPAAYLMPPLICSLKKKKNLRMETQSKTKTPVSPRKITLTTEHLISKLVKLPGFQLQDQSFTINPDS